MVSVILNDNKEHNKEHDKEHNKERNSRRVLSNTTRSHAVVNVSCRIRQLSVMHYVDK